MRVDDVIVKVGDREVRDPISLKNETASLPIGLQTPVTYYRDGKVKTVEVTIGELGERPPPRRRWLPRP